MVNPNWKNKLWYSLNDHYTQTFGEKAAKVTLSGGFTCPTRDGTKGFGGCAFCDEHGSGSFYSVERASEEIEQKINLTIPDLTARFRAKKFIAYFQSFTNTYAPIDYLKKVYDSAILHEKIDGLSVGTRPDALSDESLDLLNEYGKTKYVCVELGIQTFNDEVQHFYERKETVAEGAAAIENALKRKNIQITIHLMFGAPMEIDGSREKLVKIMRDAALRVNQLGIHGVKLHQLMILKKTILEKRYAIEKLPFVELDDYNHGVMEFLEQLNPKIYVERTHGLSPHPDGLVGPTWSDKRLLMMNSLHALMSANSSYQGKKFNQ